MGAVNIIVNAPQRSPAFTMITASGRRFVFPSAPEGFTYSGGAKYGTIERQGRRPAAVVDGMEQTTLGFDQIINSLDYQSDIEAQIKVFTEVAARGERVRFTGGSPAFEQGIWWFPKISVDVKARATNNKPSKAVLSWTLIDAWPVTARVSRPKPRPKPKPRRPVPVAARRPAKPSTTRVIPVRNGDTLWGLAAQYLRNGLRWREIWNLNRGLIKNPNVLKVGWRLRVPAR